MQAEEVFNKDTSKMDNMLLNSRLGCAWYAMNFFKAVWRRPSGTTMIYPTSCSLSDYTMAHIVAHTHHIKVTKYKVDGRAILDFHLEGSCIFLWGTKSRQTGSMH